MRLAATGWPTGIPVQGNPDTAGPTARNEHDQQHPERERPEASAAAFLVALRPWQYSGFSQFLRKTG